MVQRPGVSGINPSGPGNTHFAAGSAGMERADRMASPLILRAVALPSGRLYMPVALLLDIAKLEGRQGRVLATARVDPAAGVTTVLPVWSNALAGLADKTPLRKYGSGDAFQSPAAPSKLFSTTLFQGVPDDPPYSRALSIGPVQTFISAARRTRDLWAGSALLSALAAAAARALLANPDAKSSSRPR